jgi:meso-butanediol dehydrogenase / (S,S)-butanediol dehydrogenase / diacetyl reductase
MHGRANASPRGGCFVVTGAAGGIGSRVALDLAADGHHVWCLDRDLDRLAETVARVQETGAADLIALDVADEAAVAAGFATVGGACGGRLDGLVNSAGVLVVGRFEAFEPAQWERVFRVNVLGSYLTIKHAIPLLRAAQPGRVVNVASIAGKLPGPFTAPYNASKAAVISLTRSAALALAPDILVNSVCPGPLDTAMYEQMNDGLDEAEAPAELRFAQRSTVAPLGRAGTVAEISAVILFLLSHDAGFITGEDVNASGGMVMY